MIHKISKLTSIGRFGMYEPSGDVCFRKLTLIYADNGSGKTTLTSVFRSLTLNEPNLIRTRISTNATAPQAAQIVERENSTDIFHTFRPGNGWSVPLPNIEIFDTHFIDANIFSGCEFTEDHKKQLYQFVIGAQGVAIQQQIEKNKESKSTLRTSIEALENQLVQLVGCNLERGRINGYIKLSSVPATIDAQIAAAQNALSVAIASATIQTLPFLDPVPEIAFDWDGASVVMDIRETSQGLQNNVLQEIFSSHCAHLKENSVTAAEDWLKTGYLYFETVSGEATEEHPIEMRCPLCKQNVNSSLEIIRVYAQHFNERYNALVRRLNAYVSQLRTFQFDVLLEAISQRFLRNDGVSATWSIHLPDTVTKPIIDLAPESANLAANLASLMAILNSKIEDPLAACDDCAVDDFSQSLVLVNSKLEMYNRAVNLYNTAIQTLKSNIMPVAQAQIKLDALKATKKRFEAPIVAICNQIAAERQSLRSLEDAYPSLVQQQENAATAFFTTYKDRVNFYLQTVFRTPFRIDSVMHVRPQGKAVHSRMAYQLTVNGSPISFDATQQHNTKECLSEGDKSTLALAFFMAKLDIDPQKQSKILVFDDPLSSFDRNRRLSTVEVIKELLQHVKQIIVFSHNELFLHALSVGTVPAEKKELHIRQDFTNGTSSIQPVSIDQLVEHDYFKHIKELEGFLGNADLAKKEQVLGLMRNVLESNLRFRFYRQIPKGVDTLGSIINALVAANVPFRDDTNRVDIISCLRRINGISCKPHHGDGTPDFAQIGLDPSNITATELAQQIQSTLELIDDRI